MSNLPNFEKIFLS